MIPVRCAQGKSVRPLPAEFPLPLGIKGEGYFQGGRDAFEIQEKRTEAPPPGGRKRRFYQLGMTAKKGYVTNAPPSIDRESKVNFQGNGLLGSGGRVGRLDPLLDVVHHGARP